jgi:urea transport system permease protein
MKSLCKYYILTLLLFVGVSVSVESFSQIQKENSEKSDSVDDSSGQLVNTSETVNSLIKDTLIEKAPEKTLEEIGQQLVGAKLRKVAAIITELEAKGGEEILPLFQALVGGDLFYIRESERLVSVTVLEDKRYKVKGVFDYIAPVIVEKKTLRKVKTNNRLRSDLRAMISRITLFSKSSVLRQKAVANLLEDLNEENIELLVKAQQQEKNKKVLTAINSALAVYQLKSSDAQARLSAINLLSGNLEPVVRNELVSLLEKNDDGSYKEANQAVINAAEKLVESIDGNIRFYGYIETLFFGLSLGSVLLLVAAGLAITFGVMGVINMAHGEMIMLGAYTTYVIQLLMPNNIALSIVVAIPAAFVVSASVGVIIERGVIQFLNGRPLETLLATFGISLILQQLVRSIFSPLNKQVETPAFMSGALEINPIFSITYNRLYILVFAFIVFFVMQLILKKTSLGLHVRAVSQNRDMAKCMGIRTDWVDAMTFGLGSGIAGLAGVALSQITNVGPNLGQTYIIDSFMVVVFGGVGNLWGTLVGGFSLGVLNKFLEPATGAVLANIIVLVGIILFIQKRPKGLFPQKGRAAE